MFPSLRKANHVKSLGKGKAKVPSNVLGRINLLPDHHGIGHSAHFLSELGLALGNNGRAIDVAQQVVLS